MNKKDEMYYDAMDLLNEDEVEEAIEILQEILKMDMDFVPAYVGLAAGFRELGNFKKERECANLGFEITKKMFPVWPKRIEWGIMDNRAYMRSICDKATISQISGDRKTSEELYRLLLKMNPNDNQGIRYLIAGMFASLGPKDIDDMFDEGNAKQDWSKLRKMVIDQNKKHNFWKEPKY